jgi:hypothetical protein
MKLKNKIALTLVCGAALTVGAFGLSACGDTSSTDTETLESAYATYVANAESSGTTPSSYSEWLSEIKGEKGDTGADGVTPTIGTNGNWYLDGKDTGVSAKGEQGDDGEQGNDGKDGKDGVTITNFYVLSSGEILIKYSDGTSVVYQPTAESGD